MRTLRLLRHIGSDEDTTCHVPQSQGRSGRRKSEREESGVLIGIERAREFARWASGGRRAYWGDRAEEVAEEGSVVDVFASEGEGVA